MSWFPKYLSFKILNSYPNVLLWILSLARRITPFLRFGNTVVILYADDIKEVLGRSNDFEVGPGTADKMLMGDFLLGMDPWLAYHKMHAQLHKILHTGSRIDFARYYAEEAADKKYRDIEAKLDSGEFVDLIDLYASGALSLAAQELMGVHASESDSSKILSADDLFAAMSRKVGSVIASDNPAPFGLQKVAEESAKEFKKFLRTRINDRINELIKQAKQANSTPSIECLKNPKFCKETILDALICEEEVLWEASPPSIQPLSANTTLDRKEGIENIVAKLAGLILAGSTPLMKAFSLIIKQLLTRRDWEIDNTPVLTLAIDASTSIWKAKERIKDTGDASVKKAAQQAKEAAENQLEAIVFEALRFNPVFPMLARYCPRTTSIAVGTSRELEISANTNVMPALASGMFDGTRIPRSEKFSCPRDDDTYLHFGHGPHYCLGDKIATAQILAAVSRLLSHSKKRSFSNAKYLGMTFDGPAVHSLKIKLGK